MDAAKSSSTAFQLPPEIVELCDLAKRIVQKELIASGRRNLCVDAERIRSIDVAGIDPMGGFEPGDVDESLLEASQFLVVELDDHVCLVDDRRVVRS